MRWRGAAVLVGLLGLAAPAQAMQFEQIPTSATELMLGGRGPIVKGDAARLEQALAAVPAGQRLLALALDSPGGNVVEGEQLARLIRARALSVVIPSNSKCVSACFLLFAAAPRRLAASDALVGVHSASEEGEETGTSLAVTTLMARAAAELGIPPAIIGKMVQTTPGRVEWLTPADLASMNVIVYDDGGQPAPAGAPAPVRALPRPAPAGPGLAAGREDRRAWEAWVAGLRGASRDGALFAAEQLGAAHPVSCFGPNGVSLGDFSRGCEAAWQRLAPVQPRLRGNPDYLAGWNSAPAPVVPAPVAPAPVAPAPVVPAPVATASPVPAGEAAARAYAAGAVAEVPGAPISAAGRWRG